MYDKTPLSRGEGLDPKPLAPGEYIEHMYRKLTCSNGIQVFPMLNVCKTGIISLCKKLSITSVSWAQGMNTELIVSFA